MKYLMLSVVFVAVSYMLSTGITGTSTAQTMWFGFASFMTMVLSLVFLFAFAMEVLD